MRNFIYFIVLSLIWSPCFADFTKFNDEMYFEAMKLNLERAERLFAEEELEDALTFFSYAECYENCRTFHNAEYILRIKVGLSYTESILKNDPSIFINCLRSLVNMISVENGEVVIRKEIHF